MATTKVARASPPSLPIAGYPVIVAVVRGLESGSSMLGNAISEIAAKVLRKYALRTTTKLSSILTADIAQSLKYFLYRLASIQK